MRALNLSEIAEQLGGQLVGDHDPVITGAGGLEDASPGDLTFVAKEKLLDKLTDCQASGVIIGPGMKAPIPAIVVENPYHAFGTFLNRFQTDLDRVFPPGLHPTAVVHSEAEVDQAASIGAYCVIGAGVKIGKATRVAPQVTIGPDVEIGEDCLVYSQVAIREGTKIGDRVILHAGCCVGTDGFGYLPTDSGPKKIPQVGIVVLEDDVEIGAGVCIDRATVGKTLIGAGSKIDNQVQIGHNVVLGRCCALSAQTGISGSTVLEDGVTMGGQVGVGDHLRIGRGSKIAGKTGIIRDVEPEATMFGYPGLDFKEAFRLIGAMRKLPELLRRVTRLEQAVKTSDSPKEKSQ